MHYNWQQKDWPNFRYDTKIVEPLLFRYAEKAGRVSGLLDGLPNASKNEAVISLMVSEAIKTSEIEGEYLSRQDVMSSVRNNLGFGSQRVRDLKAQGIGELMVSVRKTFAEKLTQKTIFSWHELLMKGSYGIEIGQWRTHEEPMQIVSGALGKEKIHFEAPPSRIVPTEMARFVDWFNDTETGGSLEIKMPIIRSAIAHLYFESIHPFEDGNGRIGRAISEKALSQYLEAPVVLSLSQTIEADKKDYYNALQKAQHSNEITEWLIYFTNVTLKAQIQAEALIVFTLAKARFFDRQAENLNERQNKVIKRMLEEGPKGFEGGMSAKKYMAIARVSKATATRDLQDLVNKKTLLPYGSGRSVKYELNLDA